MTPSKEQRVASLVLASLIVAAVLEGCAPAGSPSQNPRAASQTTRAAKVIPVGTWGSLESGARIRILSSHAATSGAQLQSLGLEPQPETTSWVVVRMEVADMGRTSVSAESLGMSVVYPNMLVSDPDDDHHDTEGPAVLTGECSPMPSSAGGTSCVASAFLVPRAALEGALSLRTASSSGADQYFRLR